MFLHLHTRGVAVWLCVFVAVATLGMLVDAGTGAGEEEVPFAVTCESRTATACTVAQKHAAVSDTVWATGWAAKGVQDGGSGWDRLAVRSSPDVAPSDGVYAAGLLEGYATASTMADFYTNMMGHFEAGFGPSGPPAPLWAFLEKNIAWTKAQVASAPKSDPYWAQVGLLVRQVEGILDGYNMAAPGLGLAPLVLADVWLMNSNGDLVELIPAVLRPHDDPLLYAIENSHCSAMIKVVDGDVLITHSMWANYWQLIPMYKEYNLEQGPGAAAATTVSMSSYPGFVSSEDDFYMVSNGLVVMETSNDIFNTTLYELIVPESLLSWVRVMVANRLTPKGQAQVWPTIFEQHNSGTYNNQWMVFDTTQVAEPSTGGLPNNTFWIASQIPGLVVSRDMTSFLNVQSYWPSYNIPFFPEIYEAAGYSALLDKYGPVWSYSQCPRAQVFARGESNVTDVASLKTLIRENDYTHDPLAMGCPLFQLAARADLPPTTPSNPAWGGRCAQVSVGQINAKITSVNMFRNGMEATIIAGPSHESLPPFSWDELDGKWVNMTHVGQPNVFDFDWIVVQGASLVV